MLLSRLRVGLVVCALTLAGCGSGGGDSGDSNVGTPSPPPTGGTPPPAPTTPPGNRVPLAVTDLVTAGQSGSFVVDVLANDSDPDGDTLSLEAVGVPTVGRAERAGDSVRVELPDGFTGQAMLTYTVSDGAGGQADGQVRIDVGRAAQTGNQPPQAVADTAATEPGTPVTVAVLANDSDPDGDAVALLNFTQSANGTVTRDDAGTPLTAADDQLRFVPAAGFSGAATFDYTLSDGAATARARVSVLVRATLNQPPEQVCGQVMIGPVRAASVAVFELDGAGDPLAAALATTSTDDNGQWCLDLPVNRPDYLVRSTGGTYFDPADSGSASGLRTIDLGGLVLESVLFADAATTAVTPLTSGLVARMRRDSFGTDFDPVSALIRSQAADAYGVDVFATPAVNPLDPGTAELASRSLAMVLGGSAGALNRIAVALGDDAPDADVVAAFASDLADCSLDGSNFGVPVRVAAGPPLPANLSLDLEILRFRNNLANTYGDTPLVSVDPAPCQLSAVLPDLQPPQFVALPASVTVSDPLASGVLPADGRLQPFFDAVVVTDNRPDPVTIDARLEGDLPLPDRFAPDSVNRLVFVATDAAGNRAVSAVREIVVSSSRPPLVLDDVAVTPEDTDITVDVLANDAANGLPLDVASVRVERVDGPVTVQVDTAVGTLVVTPLPDEFGTARVLYSVANIDALRSANAELVVTITPRNDDPPTAANDSAGVAENASVSIDVLANDGDPDEGGLAGATVELAVGPTYGSAVVDAATRRFVYTPDPDFDGVDSFTYRVRDATDRLSLDAVVSLTISGVNQAPTVSLNQPATLDEDVVTDFVFLARDPEDRLDASSFVLVATPAIGTAEIVAPLTVRYTPDPDVSGTDALSVQVADSAGLLSGVFELNLTVNAVNDAPVARDDAASGPERSDVVIDVLANDTDIDDAIDPASVSIVAPPANGAVLVEPDGRLRYTSAGQFNGQDTFTYTVRDTAGAVSPAATVVVDVLFVDDAPVAGDDALIVVTGNTGSVQLAANDSDPEAALDLGSVTVVDAPAVPFSIDPATGELQVDASAAAPVRTELTYRISDAGGQASNLARVAIAIWPTDDPDFDGVASSIETAVGTDPAVADARIVHIDAGTTAATPDGSSWAQAYASPADAGAAGALAGDPGVVTYVLLGNNTDPAVGWSLELNGACDNIVLVGSVADLVPTPTRNGDGRWTTALTPAGAARPLELAQCRGLHAFGLRVADGTGVAEGGGALVTATDITFHDVTFENNAATEAGGALAVRTGGGDPRARVTLRDGLLRFNTVSAASGVVGRGGAIDAEAGTELVLERTRLWRNSLLQAGPLTLDGGGGALHANDATISAADTVVSGNRSDTVGGGIVLRGATAIVDWRGGFVNGNDAASHGGGIYAAGTGANVVVANTLITANVAAAGGGVYASDTLDTALTNATTAYNLAQDGGAIWLESTSPRIDDSIMTGNVGTSTAPSIGGPPAAMSALNAANNVVDVAWAGFGGTNNLLADPRFGVGFYLDHDAANRSPAIDHSVTFQSDSPGVALDTRFTDALGAAPDNGALDAGYHYPGADALAADTFGIELVRFDPTLQHHVLGFFPTAAGARVGPGRRVFIAGVDGTAVVRGSRYTNALTDPIGNGRSTLAVDRGDGVYEVMVQAPTATEFFLDLWIDTDIGPALVRYSVTINTT